VVASADELVDDVGCDEAVGARYEGFGHFWVMR